MVDVELKIKRFDPDRDSTPHWETYRVQAEETDKVLDALHEVKWHQDGTLSFRRSCAHGVCGSDAMVINGSKDRLFASDGVKAAFEKIERCYAKANAPESRRCLLYDAPHEFNLKMQEEAWSWLKRWV